MSEDKIEFEIKVKIPKDIENCDPDIKFLVGLITDIFSRIDSKNEKNKLTKS